ncbi:NINE protein [Gordonia sp. (in: high G+C Gram-positive bacteria)]|uniref:TM2 domain-containing protein n=1 Tax=Gordonia sp. (in: high G+C Gram-positive bacteria) TaxID=84139 RepID=UPI003C72B093
MNYDGHPTPPAQNASAGGPDFYPSPPQFGGPSPTNYQAPPSYPVVPTYPAQASYPVPTPYVPMVVPYGVMGQLPAPYGQDPATGLPYSSRTKAVAGLLQFFLGSFGAGRWYIGSYGVATAQLLLFFFGLVTSVVLIGIFVLMGLGIWAFIDAIMMFTGAVRDGDGRVLR